MENASKALLITASVLMGVLVLSVAVVLFNSFAGSSKNIVAQIEDNKISEFNSRFLKYYGDETIVTAHDVITIGNLAKQSNKENGIENLTSHSEKSGYIQIYVKNDRQIYNNFEKLTEQEYLQFIKNNMQKPGTTDTKLFKITQVKTSSVTKKVIYIKIENKN